MFRYLKKDMVGVSSRFLMSHIKCELHRTSVIHRLLFNQFLCSVSLHQRTAKRYIGATHRKESVASAEGIRSGLVSVLKSGQKVSK